MLIDRLARLASAGGLELKGHLTDYRLGLLGSVRAVKDIPLQLTNRAREQLAKLGESGLPPLLNGPDVWAVVELEGARGPNALDEFVRGAARPKYSLLVSTRAVNARLVPDDSGLYFLVIDITPPRARFNGCLVLGTFREARDGFEVTGFARAIAYQQRAWALVGAAQSREDADRRFLLPYRRLLENVRDYLTASTPCAEYEITRREPLRLACPDEWPKAFTMAGARVVIPYASSERTRTCEVIDLDDDGELLLRGDDSTSALLDRGIATLQPAVEPINRMLGSLGAVAGGGYPEHLALLEALRDPERLPRVRNSGIEPKGLGAAGPETAKQHEAVAMVLGCPDVSLIHGPPGTGKTTVICELIRQFVGVGQKVLLVAPTHVALDNVLERIGAEPGVFALRIGSSENVDERVQGYMIERYAATTAERVERQLDDALRDAPADDAVVAVQREWREALATSRDELGTLFLLNANLVCGTPIGIATSRAFPEAAPVFDVMIMDEASKATVTDFLVPAARAKRWVLVGDHRQLAPYADAQELDAVVTQRARRHVATDIGAEWSRGVAVALRRDFEQRMHPRVDVRQAQWTRLMEAIVGRDASAVRALAALPRDGARWRRLADEIDAGGCPIEELKPLATTQRPLLVKLAKFVAELLELQRAAMPSVFEVFLQQLPSDRVVRLDYQQRMNPALAEFSRANVYDGMYESATGTSALSMSIPSLEEPSIWIDTSAAPPVCRYQHPRPRAGEEGGWASGSYSNEFEVQLAAEVVDRCIAWAAEQWHVVRDGVAQPFEIGVIAFYASQAQRLRTVLFRQFCDGDGRWRRPASCRAANGAPIDLHVSVVDRFQGQQKDVVIVSFTRSNPRRIRGHVNNLNRLNVAVTRARYKRILIGDSSTVVDRTDPNDLIGKLHQSCDVRSMWGKAWHAAVTS